MALCTKVSWLAVNYKYRDWYLVNYPWLLEFPPDTDGLRDFYVDDMKSRNLTPLDSFKNCYEFLLSYGLENLPLAGKAGRFTGQTFWGRLVKDQWNDESILWTALKKTGSQIGGTLSWIMPAAILFLIIYASKK